MNTTNMNTTLSTTLSSTNLFSIINQKQEKPIDKKMLDLYADYLLSSFSYTTATGLSNMLDHQLSHDKVTRFLSEREYSSKDLWILVKPVVHEIENDNGVIIFDDTVEEKMYTDENDIVAWHFDHTTGRSVKGINILSCVYQVKETTIPLAFEIIKKTISFLDPKTGKTKRRSEETKNQIFRDMFEKVLKNKVKFSYVLADSWFASNENMKFVAKKNKHFIFAIKDNRLVALSKKEKLEGNFKRLDSLLFEENAVAACFFKGLELPVLVSKQIFTNEDENTGVLYLVTNDLSLDASSMSANYKKRWKVEEYHKSIKSNTGLSKSPTKTSITQNNHFFASIYAFFKLELLSAKTKLNHFALRSKIYVRALMASFKELQNLQKNARVR